MGLLQPHGRHGRGHGQARLSRRLRISIIAAQGSLPVGEHPFNRALDAIHDDVTADSRGRKAALVPAMWRMESPDWAYSTGIDLPADTTRHGTILAIVVRRLNEARRALPDAQYEITLDDRPFAWNESTGFQPPPE